MIDRSVLVVGGGAIGGSAAARMTGEVRRVVVLDANEEHVARLRDPGLKLTELGTEHTVPLEAVTSAGELGDEPFDFALVGVKVAHHEAALRPLLERELAATYVSLGNGLIQERLAAIVGSDRLVAGLVEWGGTNVGPGVLVRDTDGPIVIGELDGQRSERLSHLAEVLAPVGEVRVTDNARGMIWSKLMINSTFTGLSAVSGLRYGEVAAHPVGRDCVYGLWSEGYDVGRADGRRLETMLGLAPEDIVVRDPARRDEAAAALDRAMEKVGATFPSMLQDLQQGRLTEVDVVNGGVAERGRAHGIPTPLNDRVVELVHAMERGERTPSPESFDELRALAGRSTG